MSADYIISCESTVDLPYSEVQSRNIPVLFYRYTVVDTEYEDDMCRTPGFMDSFYKNLAEGSQPHTSQINAFAYREFFEKLLQDTDCVIHVAFGSGMTRSVQGALIAAEELKELYPQKTVHVVDSLCSSGGYGMLVNIAADMRDEGQDCEAVLNRLNYLSTRIHHQFFATDLSHYRRGGRISGPAAALGTLLNICPIMHLDKSGHIIAYTKVRGKKAAIEKTVSEMLAHAENGADYDGPCYLVHSACKETAEQTIAKLKEAFPKVTRFCLYDIGAIIAAHTGTGTVALFFVGDERAE